MSSAGLDPKGYRDEEEFWHRDPPWWKRAWWAVFGRPERKR